MKLAITLTILFYLIQPAFWTQVPWPDVDYSKSKFGIKEYEITHEVQCSWRGSCYFKKICC